MTSFEVLSLFSGSAFIFYGINCLFTKKMSLEFERFGIPKYLKLTGVLQIAGGLSLVIGLWTIPPLAFIGAVGLSILMFMGFFVRLKIKDSLLISTPALAFALLNAFIAYKYFLLLNY
jgi:uncharacterized membrane protein YphA (DoxX/SURF4 family)